MHSIKEKFSGLMLDPLSSEIGPDIQKATELTNQQNALQEYLRICTKINSLPDGPNVALRAIVKRFQESASTNEHVAMSTLAFLDICVKNCGIHFLLSLAKKRRLEALTTFTSHPSNASVPPSVRSRLLGLLQTWSVAYGNRADLKDFSSVFSELVAKGVEFPPLNSGEVELLKNLNLGDTDTAPSKKRLLHGKLSMSSIAHRRKSEVTVRRIKHSTNDIRSQITANLQQITLVIGSFKNLLESYVSAGAEESSNQTQTELIESAHVLQKHQRNLIQMIQQWQAALSNEHQLNPTGDVETDPTMVDLIKTNDLALESLNLYTSFLGPLHPSTVEFAAQEITNQTASSFKQPSLDEFQRKIEADLKVTMIEVSDLDDGLKRAFELLPDNLDYQHFLKCENLYNSVNQRHLLLQETVSAWEAARCASATKVSDTDLILMQLLHVNDALLNVQADFRRLLPYKNSLSVGPRKSAVYPKEVDYTPTPTESMEQRQFVPCVPPVPSRNKTSISSGGASPIDQKVPNLIANLTAIPSVNVESSAVDNVTHIRADMPVSDARHDKRVPSILVRKKPRASTTENELKRVSDQNPDPGSSPTTSSVRNSEVDNLLSGGDFKQTENLHLLSLNPSAIPPTDQHELLLSPSGTTGNVADNDPYRHPLSSPEI